MESVLGNDGILKSSSPIHGGLHHLCVQFQHLDVIIYIFEEPFWWLERERKRERQYTLQKESERFMKKRKHLTT